MWFRRHSDIRFSGAEESHENLHGNQIHGLLHGQSKVDGVTVVILTDRPNSVPQWGGLRSQRMSDPRSFAYGIQASYARSKLLLCDANKYRQERNGGPSTEAVN